MKILKKGVFAFALFVGTTCTAFAQDGLTTLQLQQIEAVMVPLRARVETELQKNGTLYTQYLAEMTAAKKIKNTVSQKAAIATIEAQYMAFLKLSYANAAIDEATAKAQISSIVPKSIKFRFAPFLAIISDNLPVPAASTPSTICSNFNCAALDANEFKTTGILISGGEAKLADNGCGAATYGVAVLAGGGEALARIGKFVVPPAGKTRATVTATENFFMYGLAFAAIGGSYVESTLGLQFKGPNVDKTTVFKKDWAVAPLLWVAGYDETPNNTSNANVTGTFTATQGGTYSVRTYARSYTVAGAAFAGAVSMTRVEFLSNLRVCWDN